MVWPVCSGTHTYAPHSRLPIRGDLAEDCWTGMSVFCVMISLVCTSAETHTHNAHQHLPVHGEPVEECWTGPSLCCAKWHGRPLTLKLCKSCSSCSGQLSQDLCAPVREYNALQWHFHSQLHKDFLQIQSQSKHVNTKKKNNKQGVGIAQGYSAGLVIERSPVQVPAEALEEFSSPGSTFCADSFFSIQSTLMLPQSQVSSQ